MLIDFCPWKVWAHSEFSSRFPFFMDTGQLFPILVCDAGRTYEKSNRYTVLGDRVAGERKMQPEGGKILSAPMTVTHWCSWPVPSAPLECGRDL